MRSQPRPMPESVRLLWNTIEDHCERRTGKRRPVRAMERRTHLPSSTISDWFNYVSFPTWERFAQLLPYFTDEVFRADLEILWMAAWQDDQRLRLVLTGGPDESDEPPPRRSRAKIWVPTVAGVLAAVAVLVVAAGTTGGRERSGNTAHAAASPSGIAARIVQPRNDELVDNCVTVSGTAPVLHGEATYWLLIKATSVWLGPQIVPAPDGSWHKVALQIGTPSARATLELVLVRANAVVTGEWVAHTHQGPKSSTPIAVPSAGMVRLTSIRVRREPQPGNCPTPTPTARSTTRA